MCVCVCIYIYIYICATHAMRDWFPPTTTHHEAVTKRQPSHLLEIVLSSPLASYDLNNYERQSTGRTHKACFHVAHTPSSATLVLAVYT